MSCVVRPGGRLRTFASSFVLSLGDGAVAGARWIRPVDGTSRSLPHRPSRPRPLPRRPLPRPTSPLSDTDASRYVIGPDDSLQITVWQEPSVSGTFPVRPDGMISLVLVGDIQAAGLTPMHLAHDITLKLKKFIQDPIVSVVVAAVKSQRIYLVGEVQHAGPV